jgi:hypothetical protein
VNLLRSARPHGCTVGPHHDARVEQGQQCVEVAVTGSGEEGTYDLPLAGQIDIGNGGCALHAAASTTGQLAGGLRSAPDDRGDLVVGHGEHVVEDEREPLGRSQRVQDHQQSGTDRVGHERFFLGVGPVGTAHRIRRVVVQRLLPPRPT